MLTNNFYSDIYSELTQLMNDLDSVGSGKSMNKELDELMAGLETPSLGDSADTKLYIIFIIII